MPKIRVLKAFTFNYAGDGKKKAPKQYHFKVGVHEVPLHVLDHPWIENDLADGHIDSELVVDEPEGEEKK